MPIDIDALTEPELPKSASADHFESLLPWNITPPQGEQPSS